MKRSQINNCPIVYYTKRHDTSPQWILFIHSAFVDHHMFDKQIDFFSRKYNILSVDILGHGKSVETARGDTLNKMSYWIKDILLAENIEKVHIVGISLGTVLAQDFANKYSHHIASLSCFGGYDINNYDASLQKANNSAHASMFIKAIFSMKAFAKDNMKISAFTPQAQQDFYEMNIHFPKKSFRYLSSIGKIVNTCKTTTRTYPLLIGCGEHDFPGEHKAIEQWKKSEPNCKVCIFEGAGHCVNMDTPENFNKILDDFISSIITR